MRLIRRAPLYVTRPVGCGAQPWFVNSAVLLETTLGPDRLVARLKRTEAVLGRRSRGRNGPREIDMDLLLLDDRVYSGRRASVPHPRFHERAFALMPAADIAGGMRHPVLGLPVSSLARISARSRGARGVRRLHGRRLRGEVA